MNADASTATIYTKAMSNTGTIHLAAEGAAEASCASGKARPLVTPLAEAEQARPITCKRCEKLALKIDGQRIAAAANTAAIDAALDAATSVQDITAVLEAAIGELAARDPEGAASLRDTAGEVISEAAATAAAAEISEGHLDDAAAILAAASDTEAAEEAAERDAAEAAPAAPAAQAQRINQADLVIDFLAGNRGLGFTPHEISKAVTPQGRKALGLRDCCARLARDGKIEAAGGAPIKYLLPALPRPQRATPKGKAKAGANA